MIRESLKKEKNRKRGAVSAESPDSQSFNAFLTYFYLLHFLVL